MTSFKRLALCAAASAAFLFCSPMSAVFAGGYPDHPVHLILGYPPGGTTDLVARLLASGLQDKWGQPVLVENRPGGAGNIAADVTAKSDPDGYTIILAVNDLTLPSPDKTYDPVRNFAPISLLATQPALILSGPNFPAKTLPDLIALAKQEPNKLTAANGGIGSAPYMALEMFMQQTGIKLVNVPYKGTSASIVGLLGGETDLLFAGISGALDHVKSGKFHALAITSASRLPLLPDVPTVAEAANLPNFNSNSASSWFGMLAPAGTPDAIVNKLHDDLVAVMNGKKVQDVLAPRGIVTIGSTPQAFADFIRNDVAASADLMKTVSAQ
jgi:tripartite-type tricarboxylate transporter receptor subunit TctC